MAIIDALTLILVVLALMVLFILFGFAMEAVGRYKSYRRAKIMNEHLWKNRTFRNHYFIDLKLK